jgi:hypothetical protein
MQIKKNIYHVLFFDAFFVAIGLFLNTLGFFLGFEITKKIITIYLGTSSAIIFLGAMVFFLYFAICKTYYVFANDSFKIIKDGVEIMKIDYDKIIHCEYHRFASLFLGDSKGGKLVVNYVRDGVEQYIEISLLKRQIEKIDYLRNIVK